MANKRQGYLDKAKRQKKRRVTTGAFTEYCGGKVTDKCIESALNSNSETLRSRAQFAKNMRKMQMGGGEADSDDAVITDGRRNGGIKDKTKKLPGGIMKPIGYGAFKFHGNKHDEAGLGSDSGIILQQGGKKKPGLEVEDGELQVDVDTDDGKKEYIVSDYIKNPATGNTISEDLERELEKAKNNREAAKITARYVRLNEKLRLGMSGEGDPDRVKSQEGQFATDDPAYVMPADEDDPNFELSEEGARAREFIEGQSETELGTYEKEGEKVGTDEVESLKKNNPWFNWKNFDPANDADVKRFQEEYNEKAPEGQKIKVDGKLGAQTASAYIPYEEKPEEQEDLEMPTMEMDEEEIEDEGPRDTPAPEEEAPAEEAEGKSVKFRPRMPGTMLQALGPAYALTKNLSTRKMSPEYAKEVRMGRVDMDPQRAAAQQQSQGASSGITSSVAGPAALAMQQANLAQGQSAQRQIDSQETGSNIQIANTEKGINAGIRQQNAANAMQASQVNANAMNRTAAMNQQKNIDAMNQLGKIGSQTVKDYNQQYANFGSDIMNYGPVAGDYYSNVYRGNTPFGLGSRDISVTQMDPDEVTNIYNRRAGQQEDSETPETTETTEETGRRGGYIKKSNKIRRNKRRRR